MTATDWWPEQSGRITDGLTIMCNAEGATTEGATCKFGTSTASQIRVTDSTAIGDGWGIMLKAAATAGEGVPVLVYGLYKFTTDASAGNAITQGDTLINSTSTTCIVPVSGTFSANLKAFGGASRILGMAMQTSTANGDSIVIFVGKGL